MLAPPNRTELTVADDARFMVLQDPEGALYALPWDVVQRAKLPTAVAEDVAEAIEGDVSGFAHRFFTGKLLTAESLNVEQSYKRHTGFDWNTHLAAVRMTPDPLHPDD